MIREALKATNWAITALPSIIYEFTQRKLYQNNMSSFNDATTGGNVADTVNSQFQPNEEQPHYRLAVAHEEMNSRRRNTMEDCHRVLPIIDEDLSSYSYFAIYDGHGGRQIVDFLENSLEMSICKELKQPDDASVLERLSRAYLITDMESRSLNITTSGATAVSALLYKDKESSKRTLYVANVGDSRAVLVSKVYPQVGGDTPGVSDQKPAEQAQVAIETDEFGSDSIKPSGYIATRLSYDHRAEDKQEQERIVTGGGFITRNRVLGILAVSRSFGDHGLKDFVTGIFHQIGI